MPGAGRGALVSAEGEQTLSWAQHCFGLKGCCDVWHQLKMDSVASFLWPELGRVCSWSGAKPGKHWSVPSSRSGQLCSAPGGSMHGEVALNEGVLCLQAKPGGCGQLFLHPGVFSPP